MTLTGKHYRSRVQDCEDDNDYGEVTHPIGSTFTVGEALQPCMYAVLWEAAVDADGKPVPAAGMWTIWSADEIATQAEEVTA